MPNTRFIIILLALFALTGLAVLQLSPVDAQEPFGITITPTNITEVPPTTEVPPPPPTTVVPPPTTAVPPPTTAVPPPPDTVTPTGEPTIPPPSVTETPSSDDPGNRATHTPPVLPATGQSPIGGSGFPIEGIFAIILLALVGWFLLRGVTGARTQK